MTLARLAPQILATLASFRDEDERRDDEDEEDDDDDDDEGLPRVSQLWDDLTSDVEADMGTDMGEMVDGEGPEVDGMLGNRTDGEASYGWSIPHPPNAASTSELPLPIAADGSSSSGWEERVKQSSDGWRDQWSSLNSDWATAIEDLDNRATTSSGYHHTSAHYSSWDDTEGQSSRAMNRLASDRRTPRSVTAQELATFQAFHGNGYFDSEPSSPSSVLSAFTSAHTNSLASSSKRDSMGNYSGTEEGLTLSQEASDFRNVVYSDPDREIGKNKGLSF